MPTDNYVGDAINYGDRAINKYPPLPEEVRKTVITFEIQISDVQGLIRPHETAYSVLFVAEGEVVGEVSFDLKSQRDRFVRGLNAEWFELLSLGEGGRFEGILDKEVPDSYPL